LQSVAAELIETVCYKLLKRAAVELPPDVERAIREAHNRETYPLARLYLGAMLENIEIAREERWPICQDSGIPLYYIVIGSEVCVAGDLRKAIESATTRATKDTPLRQTLTHPLTGENPGTNVGWQMPAVFLDYKYGANYLDITVVPKGGGCEAKWSCVWPVASAPREKAIIKIVLDAISMAAGETCPPVIIGVGVGGYGVDYTEYLARRAQLRSPLNSRHPDPKVAGLEDKLYQAVNELGIGPLGVGGNTTCLGVHIDVAGTHSAHFPVAVAFYCWAARYSRAKIHPDGVVEYITHPDLKEE
jgi:fumarate hydratase subunit alpha